MAKTPAADKMKGSAATTNASGKAKKKKPAAAKHATPTKRKGKQKQGEKEDEKKTAVGAKKLPQSAWTWRRKLALKMVPPKTLVRIPACSNKNNTKTPKNNTKKISSAKDDNGKQYWPAALFMDAPYKHGILVDDNDVPNDYFQEARGYSSKTNHTLGERTLPCLTETEARLWRHKHAAHTAAAKRFPVEVARLLGTITLRMEEIHPNNNSKKKKAKPPQHNPPSTGAALLASLPTVIHPPLGGMAYVRPKQLTRKKAQEEATTELLHQTPGSDEATKELHRDPKVHQRANEIFSQWGAVTSCSGHAKTHDGDTGELPVGHKDPHYVSLRALQKWLTKGLKTGTLVDLQQDAVREFYNGLTRVPINATQILEALVDLSDPRSLYKVPLVSVYPHMTQATSNSNSNSNTDKTVWNIQLGVYMHRLLTEVFTCQTLHVVLSALDEGSYTITQPLRLPPSGPPVFASAPYPKVDMSELEYDGAPSSASDDNEDDEIEVIDVDLVEGGSRDEFILSPFSTKGLLKLLENKGCDTSNVSTFHFLTDAAITER
jgi:hypothetical protein